MITRCLLAVVAVLFLVYPGSVLADCGRSILEQPACQVDDVMFVCASKDRYKALESYMATGEMDLYKREVMASVMVGQCDLYVPGDRVWRMGNSGFDGFVSVRKQGRSKAYWVRNEAFRVMTSPASDRSGDRDVALDMEAYSP